MAKPTPNQLVRINQLALVQLSEEETYVFPAKLVGDNIIPGRFYRITANFLKKMADQAKAGVSLLLDHSWANLGIMTIPIGRTFDSRLQQDGDELALYADHYMKWSLFFIARKRGQENFPYLFRRGDGIMADEQNKDVVGARINLDTSKIIPAFKVIDDGAKQNAASFKTLNAELAVTAKSYETMAKSADKLALTADQRRNKILAESEALVASRNAHAEYYKAKTQQLDLTNQVVDSKLKAQQAIQVRRQDAILQQEKEHHDVAGADN
jgi:hypothetical protein